MASVASRASVAARPHVTPAQVYDDLYRTFPLCEVERLLHAKGYLRESTRAVPGRLHYLRQADGRLLCFARQAGDRYPEGMVEELLRQAEERLAPVILKRHAPPTYANGRPGTAKVTPDDVRVIRAKAKAGKTYSELAREYGLSSMAISDIVRRITWRRVE